jgi:acrylyl-CoA reductase (NADPH)
VTDAIQDTFRAFVADHDAGVESAVREMTDADIADGDVLIAVEWSSLNFKDGLAAVPEGKVARRSPLIVGVDMAGVVMDSSDGRFAKDQAVLAHGYELGTAHNGGLSERARVPADWVVTQPDGLTDREAMILGTAGFTAGLSLHFLEQRGLEPGSGAVLVTGATGGVGSSAVAILAARGYEVHASTGKDDAHEWLRTLGASEVLGRSDIEEHAERPLSKQLWAATIDSVGGRSLAGALTATQYGGAIAASGLTGGVKLDTTVMPFILRGVSLIGVDSAMLPIDVRQAVWNRLGSDYRPADLELLVDEELGLDGVAAGVKVLLDGRARGRKLVRPSA